MMLPYAYVPSRDDLWLYEDHTVTWTYPEPGSTVVKRAVAWNPGSPLYPYRNSLAGINAKYRFWGTAPSEGQKNFFAQYNDPNDPANNANFYNAFPPTMNLVSPRFMYGCSHCFNVQSASERNPAALYSNYYAPGSPITALTQFRWINPANNSTLDELTANEVLAPYARDTANGYPLIAYNDMVPFEAVRNVAATPLTVVDMRNADESLNAWMIDGNTKIVRLKFSRAWVQSQQPTYLFDSVKPDGTQPPSEPGAFQHDSGSFVLAEISPPTSAAAGDGVLGIVPYHIVSVPWNAPVYGYDDVSASGFLAQTGGSVPVFRAYAASRGYPMPVRRMAWRRAEPATETVQQQILSEVS